MATATSSGQGADISLTRVEISSYLALVIMVAASWLLFASSVAISVLVGGFTVIVSFQWLKRDALKLVADLGESARRRFLLKCLGRLALLALLFYLLIRYQALHIPGLLAGLATIPLGIMLAFISRVNRLLA